MYTVKDESYNQSQTYEQKLSFTVSIATCIGRKTDFIQSSTLWTRHSQSKLCRKFCGKYKCL